MLTIHHLGKSQSERVVWLCEELAIPYQLVHHTREASGLAPASIRALHPMGTGPVMTDDGVVMSESGAIVQYIIEKHGGGRLALKPDDPNYAQYVYWFHFANASLQPVMGRSMMLHRLKLDPDTPMLVSTMERLDRALRWMDKRLGEVDWLAGEFTAADIMTVFSLTTMRYFYPADLGAYPNIKAYLKRVAARPAYQRAMQEGDPGMALLLD